MRDRLELSAVDAWLPPHDLLAEVRATTSTREFAIDTLARVGIMPPDPAGVDSAIADNAALIAGRRTRTLRRAAAACGLLDLATGNVGRADRICAARKRAT